MDRIRHLLREQIGLDPESLGTTNLNRLIQGHMTRARQSDPEAYWLQLQANPFLREQLIEQVVIGETWFFRDAAAFEPILKRALEGPMRLLSLPCASGEEPYSLAMALLSQGSHDFTIDGLDISRVSLEKARAGLYTQHSFRTGPHSWEAAYFTRQVGLWQLRDSVKARVRFGQANVQHAKFLDELGWGPYDAILFRNLSIYLDPVTRQLALAQMHQNLRPGGLLCVAASEADHIPPHLFTRTGQVCVFEATQPSRPQVRKLSHPRKAARLPEPPPPTPPPTPPAFSELLHSARELGNRGNFSEAQRICQELLERGPHAEVFHLLAALASARGDTVDQERHLRKVLYLQPDHPDALLHLASLLENSGDRAQAGRLRSRARRAQS